MLSSGNNLFQARSI